MPRYRCSNPPAVRPRNLWREYQKQRQTYSSCSFGLFEEACAVPAEGSARPGGSGGGTRCRKPSARAARGRRTVRRRRSRCAPGSRRAPSGQVRRHPAPLGAVVRRYFHERLTRGCVEGINNPRRLRKLRALGDRYFAHFWLRVLVACQGHREAHYCSKSPILFAAFVPSVVTWRLPTPLSSIRWPALA